MKGVVYKYKNEINGKIYIGRTLTEDKRKKEHIKSSKNKNLCDYNSPFHRAIRKYGIGNFNYEVLYEMEYTNKTKDVVNDILNEKESFYISEYKSNNYRFGYNQTIGGEGASGYRFNKEQKEKLSSSHINKTTWSLNNAENYIKNSEKIKNNRYSDGKHINSHLRNHPLEKEKMAYAKISKNVKCIETGEVFDSTHEIERKLGFAHQNISLACRNSKKTCGGYHWCFVEIKKKEPYEYIDIFKTLKQNLEYLFSIGIKIGRSKVSKLLAEKRRNYYNKNKV